MDQSNDNAPAKEHAYILSISNDEGERASIGFRSAQYVSPGTYARDFIAAYDIIAKSGMYFDDVESLISAASRIHGYAAGRPDVFLCANSIIQFWRYEDENGAKKGLFQAYEHQPEESDQVRSPVAYDPNATCPRWDRFLAEVQPDMEKRLYLQRLAGYMLTGWTSEEKVFLSYGSGSNGKSIFWHVMKQMLGGYSTYTDLSALSSEIKHMNERPTPLLAKLQFRRLVLVNNNGKRPTLSENLIKSVTGTDKLTARELGQPPFEFTPCFKIALEANHKPKIISQDNDILRRLDLLEWEQVFVDPCAAPNNPGKPLKDKGLMAALLAELPGILNWALAGYIEWAKSGLDPNHN